MDKEKRKKSPIKFLINLLKIVFVVTIIIVVIVFIIPFVVNLIVETPNPFGLGFINDSNKDTWISFFGSIIGGGATLTGVYITIKKQEDQRKKDLAIQYQPNIKIDTIENTSNLICIMNNKKHLHVLVTNTGRGKALDCKYYLQNERDHFYMMSSLPESESSSIFIPLNEKTINLKENYLNTTIIVTYTDFLKINKYKLIAEIGISFSEKSINKIIINLTSK